MTDDRDAERLALLDRIAERLPEIGLDRHSVEWGEMPDGAVSLLVDGGGIDGHNGFMFANAGDDLHAVGPLAPVIDDAIGCVVIRPDGSRHIARAVPDPLAE